MKKKSNFLRKLFTFNSYYSMSFEQARNEARKYGITIDEYKINQGDEASFKLDLINELIRKDMANYTKVSIVVSLITMTATIGALIIALIAIYH